MPRGGESLRQPHAVCTDEDFACYPRDEAGDIASFLDAGVDLVYAPGTRDMYPYGFATTVTPGGAGEGLEADHRDGFLSGVATVVLKLFMQTGADVAVFGEKDYQQLVVVTQMVRDLDLRIDIVPVATVREADGLAMSSRNAYLGGGRSPARGRTLPHPDGDAWCPWRRRASGRGGPQRREATGRSLRRR